MNKELFVTSTPHETKVGLVEDDQLAEIYLEREGEYTLAGSIYKGRVTRVLPGMQSAFVDIGLERDAFLYVSDFLELEDAGDGDEETIPARPMPGDGDSADGQDFADAGLAEPGFADAGQEGSALPGEARAQRPQREATGEPRRERSFGGRSGRGGRRRGGRRDSASRSPEPRDAEPFVAEPRSPELEETTPAPTVAEPRFSEPRRSESRSSGSRSSESRSSESRSSESRSSESRFSESRHSGSRSSRPRESGDQDFGPPPGYQPIVLPGESLSKYKGRPVATFPPAVTRQKTEAVVAVSSMFPEDEPNFAVPEMLSAAGAVSREGESETPRAEAAVRSMDTAALTQADGYREVEEVEEDDLDDVLAAIPEVEGADIRRPAEAQEREAHEPALHPAAHQQVVEEEIQEEDVFEETESVEEPVARTQALVHAEPVEVRQHEVQPAQVEDIQEENREHEPVVQPPVVQPPVGQQEEHRQVAEAQPQEPLSFYSGSSAGVIEEETIDEDETEMAAYADTVPEHGQYEELEEEVREPGVFAGANGVLDEDLKDRPMAPAELAEEFQMEQQQDAELEAIQEEAELQADGGVLNGDHAAQAEVRAPASTAALMQRTQRRTGFDRQQRSGRRGNNSGGSRFRRRDAGPTPQIADLLKAGQEVLIQIAKEPIAKKGARITSHIALPGRFLVYMPTVNHVGVSRKIDSDEERLRLKRIVVSERENGVGGFIVRTAAGGAAEDELRADIRFLKSLWHEIKNRAESSKAPALIYHDLNVVERVLRDQVTSDFSQIWVDNEQEYERVLRFAQRFQPSLMKRIKLYSKDIPLFEQFGLQEEMNKALKSKVWLKSGGYIVINQTEALVAIDVNTGKYVGKTARLEDTIVKTNVDAIKEIVRQIRLRDLGGIIIIDFIDMDERRNRQKVMLALEEELKGDRAPSKVLAFNDFGLVAITRKRVKQSLERTIGAPCPYCTSTGYVKSATTVCNEIYVEMRKISSKPVERTDVMLRVNPEVAKVLKADNGKWLLEMEELLKKTIIVKSDASLHQEQFDLN
jgi:Rne/Rng family ribonuclease